MSTWWKAAASTSLLVGALAASCMLPFEDYDPRIGGTTTGGGAGGGGTGGGTAGSGAGGTGAGGSGANGGSGGEAAAGGSGGSGGSPVLTVEYEATVADCVSPITPDPDACETKAGAGNINVDLEDDGPDTPEHGYLRFDLDDVLSGHSVVSVTLRMVATDDSNADGPNSGEVWEVTPFTRADLFDAAPTQVGGGALAPEQGQIWQVQPVEWPLSGLTVAPSSPVFLGVYALVAQGVSYWNLNGPDPPVLVIEYQ